MENNKPSNFLQEAIRKSESNLEKKLVYINQCIFNIESLPANQRNNLKEHLVQLYNLRLKTTMRYIEKYNDYPDITALFEVMKEYNN